MVNVFTGDHTALTGAREAVFAERLEPERSYNLTASVQQILPFGTSPLTLDLDGCYTHFSDRIILDYDQNPNLIVYGNLSGHSVSHGVAINLSQNFTRLPITYTAGFTLLAVYVEEGGRRRVVAYAPASRLSCSVSYALDRLDATLDYTATLTGRSGFRMPTWRSDVRRSRQPSPGTPCAASARRSRPRWRTSSTTPRVARSLWRTTPSGTTSTPLTPKGPILGRTISLGARLSVR